MAVLMYDYRFAFTRPWMTCIGLLLLRHENLSSIFLSKNVCMMSALVVHLLHNLSKDCVDWRRWRDRQDGEWRGREYRILYVLERSHRAKVNTVWRVSDLHRAQWRRLKSWLCQVCSLAYYFLAWKSARQADVREKLSVRLHQPAMLLRLNF